MISDPLFDLVDDCLLGVYLWWKMSDLVPALVEDCFLQGFLADDF